MPLAPRDEDDEVPGEVYAVDGADPPIALIVLSAILGILLY